MSKKISVLLLEDIPNVGRAGDIVSVTEGFARNSLFPAGRAALADTAIQSAVAAKRDQDQAAATEALQELQTVGEQLAGTELTITARTKEGDEIFGKVTAAMIASALNEQAQLSLKPKQIELPAPRTTLGSFDVVLHLSAEVETTIRVAVIADQTATGELGEEDDE